MIIKLFTTAIILSLVSTVGWGEDEELLILHCVYESSVGNTKGTTQTSTPLDSGIRVPIREQETLKISNNLIEHAYESPTPIIERNDDLIVGRYYNSELLLVQKTIVFEKQSDSSYSVLRSWIHESFGYLDYGTCTKF